MRQQEPIFPVFRRIKRMGEQSADILTSEYNETGLADQVLLDYIIVLLME